MSGHQKSPNKDLWFFHNKKFMKFRLLLNELIDSDFES